MYNNQGTYLFEFKIFVCFPLFFCISCADDEQQQHGCAGGQPPLVHRRRRRRSTTAMIIRSPVSWTGACVIYRESRMEKQNKIKKKPMTE